MNYFIKARIEIIPANLKFVFKTTPDNNTNNWNTEVFFFFFICEKKTFEGQESDSTLCLRAVFHM